MNRQSFDTSTPNGRKHFQKLLDTLLDYNEDKDETHYNDIHIYQEESLIIVEWDNIPYSHEWGGQFRYIDWDDVVMKEVNFPDGHYDYVFPEEVEERLKQWHKDHPEWVMTEYGTWTNMEENRVWAIDLNLNKWLEREVEENDSTFEVFTTSKLVGDFENILRNVPVSVLRRTGYVVIGPKALEWCMKDKGVKFNKNFRNGVISKVGALELPLRIEEFGKVEELTTLIHIYYKDSCGDNILYVVDDSNYLIARQELTRDETTYEEQGIPQL